MYFMRWSASSLPTYFTPKIVDNRRKTYSDEPVLGKEARKYIKVVVAFACHYLASMALQIVVWLRNLVQCVGGDILAISWASRV